MFIESGFWFKIFVETPQQGADMQYMVYSSIYSNGYDEKYTSHELSLFKKISGFIELRRINMNDLYNQILDTLPKTIEKTIDQ